MLSILTLADAMVSAIIAENINSSNTNFISAATTNWLWKIFEMMLTIYMTRKRKCYYLIDLFDSLLILETLNIYFQYSVDNETEYNV